MVRDQEVAGSNPVTPTIFLEKPFGQQVAGLSPFWDKSYADELPVQTEDIKDSAFGDMIRRKPLLPQVLRKLKHFDGEVDCLVPASVARLDLEAQVGRFVSKLLGLCSEGLGVDFFEQPQVQQLTLKPDDLDVPLF